MGVLNVFNVGWQPQNWSLLGYPLGEVDLEHFQKGNLTKIAMADFGFPGSPRASQVAPQGFSLRFSFFFFFFFCFFFFFFLFFFCFFFCFFSFSCFFNFLCLVFVVVLRLLLFLLLLRPNFFLGNERYFLLKWGVLKVINVGW